MPAYAPEHRGEALPVHDRPLTRDNARRGAALASLAADRADVGDRVVEGTSVRRPPEALLALARTALREDLGRGDVTSRITVLEETRARARFVAREDLV